MMNKTAIIDWTTPSNFNVSNRDCYDRNSTSNTTSVCTVLDEKTCGSFNRYGHIVPGSMYLVSFGTFLSLLIVFLNGVLLSILLRKTNITPINILLSALGFCDACCSLCLFPPLFVGFAIDNSPFANNHRTLENIPGMVYSEFSFPFCIVFDLIYITLSDCFHTMSIWLTTLLGLIKALVLMFPLQSRIYLRNKIAKIVCLAIMIICLSIYMPFALTKSFIEVNNGICCIERDLSSQFFNEFHWIIAMTYLISFAVLIVSTIYICITLTSKKNKIRRSENPKNVERNRRAAIIVTTIVIIFLLSEAISALCYISLTFTNSKYLCLYSFYQCQQLVILFGFASNFFIYWSMSKNLRSGVTNCINFCLKNQKSEQNTMPTRLSDRESTVRFNRRSIEIGENTRF